MAPVWLSGVGKRPISLSLTVENNPLKELSEHWPDPILANARELWSEHWPDSEGMGMGMVTHRNKMLSWLFLKCSLGGVLSGAATPSERTVKSESN